MQRQREREEDNMGRHRHRGERMPCEDRGIDWSDAFTSQGMPRIASNHQKLEKARKNSSPRAFRESMDLPAI